MDEKTTTELLHILNSATRTSGLLSYTEHLTAPDASITLTSYFSKKIAEKGVTAAEVIRASQIQRNYGYQILNGQKKPGRDKVIALCLALSLSLDETQKALTLSSEGLLYPRNRRDSILIFCLNKKLPVSQTNELLYEMAEESLK